MKRIATPIATMIALSAPSVAVAGTYDVPACGLATGGANHSWVYMADRAGASTSYAECPPAAAFQSGVGVTDLLGSLTDFQPGDETKLVLTAPATASITHIYMHRMLDTEADDLVPFGRVGDGALIPGENCTIAVGQAGCNVGSPGGPASDRDVNTNALAFGFKCAPLLGGSRCIPGWSMHEVWASIYDARITISDPVPPAVTAFDGGLMSGSQLWRRGVVSGTVSGTDATGIKEARVYVDGQLKSTSIEGLVPCDYTYPAPCSNAVNAALTLDPATASGGLADGTHDVAIAVVDAGGNVTKSGPAVLKTDNAPPVATGLVSSAGSPMSSDTTTVSWSNPPQTDASPITTGYWQLCASGGACSAPQAVDASGPTGSTGPLTVSPGAWSVRIWLQDQAGNVDPATAQTLSFTYVPPGSAPPDSGGSPQTGSGPSTDNPPPPSSGTGGPPGGPPAGRPTGGGAGRPGTVRRNPRLRILRARLDRRRKRVIVTGSVASGVRGRLTIVYSAPGGTRRISLPVRARTWRALVPLSNAQRRQLSRRGRGRVTVMLARDATYQGGRVSVVLARDPPHRRTSRH